jgi:hypothetical protein
MSVKCFVVERTGNTRFEPCKYPDCKEPNCGTMIEEWRRTDTGETIWGWPQFGPGAMQITDHSPHPCYAGWTNCNGKHVEVALPDGGHWDIDSRASNCTLKNDTEHRCWIKHGSLPFLTVDKAGKTCSAGAGSIVSNGKSKWHGFLRNGELVP